MKHGQLKFDRVYYRRFFDKYTRSESEMYDNWAYGWVKFLDSYLNFAKSKGKDVLELGASLGYFSSVLSKLGFNVLVSDISSYIIKKAKKLHKGMKFTVIDVEKGIKVNKNFDYIFAFEVVEHLKSPEKAFSNVYKKLKKGGLFVVSTPFPTKRSLADPTHINVHEQKWWTKLGKKTGFKKSKVIYATFLPYFYKYSRLLSIGFPFKSDIPLVNCTMFIVFRK